MTGWRSVIVALRDGTLAGAGVAIGEGVASQAARVAPRVACRVIAIRAVTYARKAEAACPIAASIVITRCVAT